MSVFIYQPDAYDRLVQVEGLDYPSYGPQKGGGYHFDTYREAWDRARARRIHWSDYGIGVTPDLVDLPRGDGTIYGKDGRTRYAVRSDGEIVLLGWSASDARKQLAIDAGFRIS